MCGFRQEEDGYVCFEMGWREETLADVLLCSRAISQTSLIRTLREFVKTFGWPVPVVGVRSHYLLFHFFPRSSLADAFARYKQPRRRPVSGAKGEKG